MLWASRMGRVRTEEASHGAGRPSRTDDLETPTRPDRNRLFAFTLYLRIAQGLWPKPVRLGVRAVGWPAGEVAALNAARIAGQPDGELRALVARLEVRRRTASSGQ